MLLKTSFESRDYFPIMSNNSNIPVETPEDICHDQHHVSSKRSPAISAAMFALGIFGNVAALVILEIRRRRDMKAGGTRMYGLFHVLIRILVVTDLSGTCMTSPVVQLSYSLNITLVGLMPDSRFLCEYFGFTMTFFSLTTLCILFTMAAERCLAIGYPYKYSQYITKKRGCIIIGCFFVASILFCVLPFIFNFGDFVQYCPGTWCFFDMNSTQKRHRIYATVYATIMLGLVLAIVVCNLFVVYQLFKMYQRRKRNGGSAMANVRPRSDRRVTSMAEEVEYLIQLVFMTIIFIICTVPLVVRVYINSAGDVNRKESHGLDLIALRFISVNSIIDPWVFILLSRNVVHCFWSSLCKLTLGGSRGSLFKLSVAPKENTPAQQDLTQPTVECTEPVTTQTVCNL
ncbi:prostaglandin E receptor 2a (subtype EP2) [Sphaeramia orbicularis]|uniref:Prostaglandin E2 receptor EP2 subtype n=1 Tax=Sphaeramia orbicularis TaxID=375764 RepID=A0A673BME9_9TELE|nr:prostaglandin E2 receptor EP2 subtype-like [Sphaeramia orbicularis]XP_030013515.1 prostaglandin E2 receptor EP2 subtype-like [Sphaeramia orbicularis]